MSRIISRLANYEGGMVPNIEQQLAGQEELEEQDAKGKKKKKAPAPVSIEIHFTYLFDLIH